MIFLRHAASSRSGPGDGGQSGAGLQARRGQGQKHLAGRQGPGGGNENPCQGHGGQSAGKADGPLARPELPGWLGRASKAVAARQRAPDNSADSFRLSIIRGAWEAHSPDRPGAAAHIQDRSDLMVRAGARTFAVQAFSGRRAAGPGPISRLGSLPGHPPTRLTSFCRWLFSRRSGRPFRCRRRPGPDCSRARRPCI